MIADFPAWYAAWQQIEIPVHRSFHLVNLLTGTRPGELARLRWQDIDLRERTLTIVAAKAGSDIAVPLSIEIVRALMLARGADPVLVFPGGARLGRHDQLPAQGMDLRRTYRTVAANLRVDEMIAHFLMGHAPAGIS